MAGQGIETEAHDFNFSTPRKPYWRSASWNSRSDSSSQPSSVPPPATDRDRRTPVLDRQSSNSRASLPPLQPLAIARKSLGEWPRPASDDQGVTDWTTPATPGRRRIKTGLDIRLDLASVQRGPRGPSEIQQKREKIAFFDKLCSRVAESHIYLGSDAVAKNREILKSNGITHVLNCVGFVCPEYFKKDFVYKTLWLQDSPGEDITSLLYDVFDYFEEVRELDGRVFVHCCQGVSRSTSLVIAYMMWRGRLSFEDAFLDVKASRGVTNPNMGFACQLLQCQKRVHADPMSPDSIPRMYRLAPHSPYDPLHLVPKEVNSPGAASLDSRGAFVIHVPHAIYVWIGQVCDSKISQAARVAAGQVVRYERAEVPVHIVKEGMEKPEFWIALSKYMKSGGNINHQHMSELNEKKRAGQPLTVNAKNQNVSVRLVPEYSVDFELFQRARQGGVVPPVPYTGFGIAATPTRIPAREDGWSRLRQKFLAGELVPSPSKDSASMEYPEADSASPKASTDSSSSDMSTFSGGSSFSSSSDHAGYDGYATATLGDGDSHFATPLSHLSISSPTTPMFYTPRPSSPNSPMFYTPRTSESDFLTDFPSKGLPAHRHDSFSSSSRIAPTLSSRSPAALLAQRRGVHLPSLEDGFISTSINPTITNEGNVDRVYSKIAAKDAIH